MNGKTLPAARNHGPSWGFAFLLWAVRWWPRSFFRFAFKVGTWVALAFMPEQRAYSREYLTVVLGRPPKLIEIWRHFFAFAEVLLLKLRAGRGATVQCRLMPENAASFQALRDSAEPALFGTFHFGGSDLLGYLLAGTGRKVAIIRLRVGNSTDTRLLGERFSQQVSFLWINNPANLLFDLKAAVEAGDSLALKCDRLEFSAKTEAFQFLGIARLFPFTIYHLAVLFNRPVVFCTAVPVLEQDQLNVFASSLFRPDPAAGRRANLQAARVHFQTVLNGLETLVRQHPSLWFNFLPLNPEAPRVDLPPADELA